MARGTGFDLTTRDSYFTILVEVFTNHILAKDREWREHKILIDDFHGIILFFIKQKFCKHHFLRSRNNKLKDEIINHSKLYLLFDLFWWEKHFVKLCNARNFDLSCSIESIISTSRNYHNVRAKSFSIQNNSKSFSPVEKYLSNTWVITSSTIYNSRNKGNTFMI